VASNVLTSRTIRGISYSQGDSFICASAASGNAGAEGDSNSAAALTVGDKYYFLGYAVAEDSGTTIKYPCKIGSSSSASSAIGWYPESVFPYATYTIKYNANGGSGAPANQIKTHGTNLTISSTKPTRTGYTFEGWALTKADADDGKWYYSSGSTCGKNENLTLYAVWTEHKLTINYYSNYATSAFADALNVVGSDKNVKVWTGEVYYDNDYTTYGLANYSNSTGSLYMTRTGYTATGNWGTSTSGGTLIDENQGYSTGQAIAKALGKDLSSGNASISLYAQWTENALTINYYSNYADYGTFDGETLNVSADSNIVVYSHKYYYDNAYSDGLYNIQNSEKLYLTRTGYSSTLNWGTSTSGGTLIDQATSFGTGQALAEAVGKSLKTGNATINLYPQWRVNVLTIKYHINGGIVNSDKYYDDGGLIALTSSSSVLEDKWNYNSGHTDGLYNAKTFGISREGYKFVGWKIGSSGTTVFDQNDGSVKPTDLANNITTGDRTITLYAVWEISGVVYIHNGTTFEPYLAYIDNGSSWDLYLAYVDDGTNWNIIS
jgi:uncharacterized repeat protein (TIGR02543 family)